MKYAIVIPDGAADAPMDELSGKTPLEVAKKPHMDRIAMEGRLGTVRTTPDGYTAGSDVCTLCLLGYEPAHYHPGRAPLEAAAMGLKLQPDEWVFRCNLVTVVDGIMLDHSAGHISDREAHALLETIRIGLPAGLGLATTFHAGVSYRNLMTCRGLDFNGLTTTPPHDIPDQPIAGHLPRGPHADEINALMRQSALLLGSHDINIVRGQLGENQATQIWLWGQGKAALIPDFYSRYGRRGAMITAVDLLRGIATLLGWDNLASPGITSYHDTDYAAQGRTTCEALEKYDIVCCHVEAPDEASHQGDAATKIASIENIDQYVVGPILQKLATFKEWRILVLPDHATQCTTRKHDSTPVPFAIGGNDVHNAVARPYTEKAAQQSDLHIPFGSELMDYFLNSQLRAVERGRHKPMQAFEAPDR